MNVFIENEAGFSEKNIFNEKTLEYKKTYPVSRAYPYPYGFILDTTSGDGDNLDCFVITDKKLKRGDVVECEAVGLMEQIDDNEEDHNLLASLVDDEVEIDKNVEAALTDFVMHVFDHLPDKKVSVGAFLGKNDAEAYIAKCQDKPTK